MKIYILGAKSDSGDNYYCAFRNKPSDNDINRACLDWDVEEISKEEYEDFLNELSNLGFDNECDNSYFKLDGKYYRSYCSLHEVSIVNIIEN